MDVLKRIVAVSISLLIGMLVLEVNPVNAEPVILNEYGCATNDLIWDEDDDPIHELNPEDFGINPTLYASRPSKFDISTDSETAKYFPPVGDQGEIQSCTTWATTYYQFTYEVNRLRGIPTGTDGSNIYSPAFVYNYLNNGTDTTTSIGDSYAILEHQGAMKLVDFPYNKNNYSYEWSNDEEKLIEALKYRAVASSITVHNTTLPEIEIIKSMIFNEHIAVVSTNINGHEYVETPNGEWCVIRSSNPSTGNHAMAVVGYDDNFKVTVNGETLTGAFKLVNSFGAGHKNKDFIWVAYDALNTTSVHENAWNYSRTREPVFGSNNRFYFITPYECDVNFAGIVSLKSDHRWNIKCYGDKGSTATTEKWNTFYSTGSCNYATYKIAFDFYEIGDDFNLDDCLTSFWTFRTKGNTKYKTDNITYKIVDNLNNRIAPSYNVSGSLASTGEFSHSIYVQIARSQVRNYGYTITYEDSQAILDYIDHRRVFSNLQEKLADYDGDGEVDIIDVILMHEDIAAAKGASYQISDYIEEWGCSLADVIQEEYNMTVSDFMTSNYDELESSNLLSVCS